MKRKLVIESSESGRQEIHYWSLSLTEIADRIHAYETKYAQNYSQFFQSYNSDSATPQEITDYMDWKSLIAELSDRNPGWGQAKNEESKK